MKTLHLSIIAILLIGIFFTLSYPKSILAENKGDVEIQNIQLQPSVVEIGKTFSISAALFNNSTIPIHVKTDDCTGSFSVVFDYHVKVHKSTNYCFFMLTYHILGSGQKFTGIDPPLGTMFIANATGVVNATITFSYVIPNQSSPTAPNNVKTISKSFLFTILDNNTETKTITETKLSPLKQFKSGIPATKVTCNQGLQLILKAEDGSPACVKSDTAQKLIKRGWAKENIQSLTQGVIQSTTSQVVIQPAKIVPTCVTQIPHQYAIAGPPGASLCPVMNSEASTKILNATGFYGIYNYTAYPGTLNFVLEPGHNATITTLLSLNAIYNYTGFSEYSNQVNITNDVIFMHDAGMHNHPGVDVLVKPQSESLVDKGSAVVTITFFASKSALPGNYWVTLPTGVCAGGEMIILTITDCTK